jgi:hypothetical protein
MLRSSRILLVAATALVLTASSPSAASAAVVPATGPFTVEAIRGFSPHPTPGGECVITLTATFSFTGTLVGSFTAPFVIAHDGACDQPAAETFVASGTYEGSVAGRSGRFAFVFAGTIDAAGNARGTLVVVRGTAGLHGLSGSLELSGVSGVGGSYRGVLAV